MEGGGSYSHICAFRTWEQTKLMPYMDTLLYPVCNYNNVLGAFQRQPYIFFPDPLHRNIAVLEEIQNHPLSSSISSDFVHL